MTLEPATDRRARARRPRPGRASLDLVARARRRGPRRRRRTSPASPPCRPDAARRRRVRARAPPARSPGSASPSPCSTSSAPGVELRGARGATATRPSRGQAVLEAAGPVRVAAHRRAHGAQPAVPPVRRRDAHPAPGSTPSTAPARASATPARPRRACGRSRSTPCAAAAASTTACRCRTPRWSRTTTSSPRAASRAAFEAVRARFPGAAGRGRVRHRRAGRARWSTAGADLVLLDNMTADDLRASVALCRGARRADRGLRRAVARRRPRRRRDRRRLPRRRRAHPLRAGARPRRRPATGRLMLLTVDVGNTNTVLGLFDGEHLYESYRIKTDPRVTADELALMFRGLLSDHQPPDGIAVCSTVPAVLDAAARDVRPLLRRRADGRRRPGRQDRRAAALPTTRARSAPTASSTPWPRTPLRRPGRRRRLRHLDQLRRRSAPRASSSAARSRPASRSRVDALAARAAQLFKVELVEPRSVIGKNTVEALQSGLLYGFAGQVDGLVRRIADELGERPVVLATGGLSHLMYRGVRDARPPRARPDARSACGWSTSATPDSGAR